MERKESVHSNKSQQAKEQKKHRKNKSGRAYIPLLDSNDPYFVKRREELDKELAENETDFDETMDRILSIKTKKNC